MNVSINKNKANEVGASIELQFFGGVTTALKQITVDFYGQHLQEECTALMWDEIHRAVREYTTYDSLMPLYGHFTEPYPKFIIKFKANRQTNSLRFQEIALQDQYHTKILKFEDFPLILNDYEEYFKTMRHYGFDVRTNTINRTVPLEHFRICYPFTLPNNWKDTTPWD